MFLHFSWSICSFAFYFHPCVLFTCLFTFFHSLSFCVWVSLSLYFNISLLYFLDCFTYSLSTYLIDKIISLCLSVPICLCLFFQTLNLLFPSHSCLLKSSQLQWFGFKTLGTRSWVRWSSCTSTPWTSRCRKSRVLH